MWRRLGEGLQPLRKDEEERLRRVFDRIDKNADGYAHQRRLFASRLLWARLVSIVAFRLTVTPLSNFCGISGRSICASDLRATMKAFEVRCAADEG
jgi:hypothetical protein